MTLFATIENNKVTNLIVAPSLEIAKEATGLSCVEYQSDDAINIGWIFDESKNTFTAPIDSTSTK